MKNKIFATLQLAVLVWISALGARAQSGNTLSIPFSGVPTGGCAFMMLAYDTTTTPWNQYYCNHGTWILGSSGSGGTVTVVSSGSLTSTALVTGGGTTTLQTPSTTSTMDASGNASFAGSVTAASGFTSTSGGGVAGTVGLVQGTDPGTTASTVKIIAPTAVTAYNLAIPGTKPTNGNCAKWITVGSNIGIADAGSACGGSGGVLLNPGGSQTIQSTTVDSSLIVTQYNGSNSVDIFDVENKTPAKLLSVTSGGVVKIGTIQVDPINSGSSITNTSQVSSTVLVGGQDAQFQSGATLGGGIVRGGDVTSGDTQQDNSGAGTLRGGDNNSTHSSVAAGAAVVRGGNITSTATGTTTTAGAASLTGGACAATSGSCTPGAASVAGGAFSGAFTNGQGADVTISPGAGTGNAIASHVKIQGPTYSQTSGTTAQTLATQFITLKKAGSTTTATATNMFSVSATASAVPAAGGFIFVHVYTTQAAPHACSDSGIWEYSVQNDTSVSTSIQRVDATPSTICDTGTLTMTAAASAASPSVISITPSWTTIVPTAVWIEVSIINPSDVDITQISD